MNVYNTLLLARHPLLQPLVKGFYLGRPRFQVWTDASGKGYGAHLGPAGNPIALYQQKRLPCIEIQPLDTAKLIKPLDDEIATHEVAALFLSLKQWKPLLHGSYVEAHLDNAHIHAALQTAATPRGTEATVAMVEAISNLIRTADIKLKVQLIKGSDNKLADALSRLAQRDHPTYTDSIRSLMDRDEKKDAEVQALFDRITDARLRGQLYTSHKVSWTKATLNWLSRTRKAVVAALFNTDRFSTRGAKSTPRIDRIDNTASQRGQIVAGNIQDGAVKAGGNLGAIRPDIAVPTIVDESSADIPKHPKPAKTSVTALEAGEDMAADAESDSDPATIPQQSTTADSTSKSPTETNITTTTAAQDTKPADKSLADTSVKQTAQTAKMAMNFEMPNKTKVSVSIESAIGVSVKISAENPFQTAKTIIMLEVASIEKPAEEPAAIKDMDHLQPAGLSDESPIQKIVEAEKKEKEAKGVGAKPANIPAMTKVGATEPTEEPAAPDMNPKSTNLSVTKVKAEMKAAAKAEKKAEKKAKKIKKVETKPVKMPAKQKTKAAKTDLGNIGEAKDIVVASPEKKVEPVKTWKEEVKAAKVDGIVSEASASTKKKAELGKTEKEIVVASPPPDQGT